MAPAPSASTRELQAYASKRMDSLLAPEGETEVLLYYGLIAPAVAGFLRGKTIAAKNWIPPSPGKPGIPNLLKRASKNPPLSIGEFIDAVTPGLLKLRKGHHLKDVREKLSPLQARAWDYFLPRKLADFFYATNGEGPGLPIDRILFDLDCGKSVPPSRSLQAASLLAHAIRDDSEFQGRFGKLLVEREPFIAWTGHSAHCLLFFKSPQAPSIYNEYFQLDKLSEAGPKNAARRWVATVAKELSPSKIIAGHAKVEDALTIDPSQTPSGKLARVPLGSLHMLDAKAVDGVSLPVDRKKLSRVRTEKEFAQLAKELSAYTPRRVVEELPGLQKLLPPLP